ncbi:hypothetical protein BGZ58_006969 [Dissophora ornata]|nr:hypothetical protein BGZ58_006969 [Dissophora ornata]
MSSPENESRAGSTSDEILEGPRPAAEASEIATPPHTTPTATTPVLDQTSEPDEEDEDEDEDEEESDEDTSSEGDTSNEGVGGSSESGNSQDGDVPTLLIPENDSEEEDNEDDPVIVLQVDPTTGLQTATTLTSSNNRPRSSALANRLRRQHHRMTSSIRSATAARTGTSRSLGSGSNSSVAESSPSGLKRPIPVVDEKTQSELRRKIMDIQRDPTVSFVDKAAMIQKLMSPHKPGDQKTNEERLADGSSCVTEDDLQMTYNNRERGLLGCQHYQRGCKLQANCCNRWFNCRFCHDDVCDHTIVRFWDDDPNKNIYHCEECGICRVGQGPGKDFFHCKKCNVCIHIGIKDSHKCIEGNLERDCPICGEYLFTSTITVIFMLFWRKSDKSV